MTRDKGETLQTQVLVSPLSDSAPPSYNSTVSDGVFLLLLLLLPSVKGSIRDIGGWDWHQNFLDGGVTTVVYEHTDLCRYIL